MNVFLIINPTNSTAINVSITPPTDRSLYIGQTIMIINTGIYSLNALRVGQDSVNGSGMQYIQNNGTAVVIPSKRTGRFTWLNASSNNCNWLYELST